MVVGKLHCTICLDDVIVILYFIRTVWPATAVYVLLVGPEQRVRPTLMTVLVLSVNMAECVR